MGVAVFFPLSLPNYAANYGLRIFPPGCVGNILLVALLAYAAVRHRLMDIDVFIMRVAATLLTGVLVVLPAAAGMIWAYQLPLGMSSALVLGSPVLAALLSLLLFSRLRSNLEQEIEASLFPSRRAARDAIRRVSADLVRLPPSEDLCKRLTASVMDGLAVDGVALYLTTPRPGIFKLANAQGSINAPDRLSRPTETTSGSHGEAAVDMPAPQLHAMAARFQWDACLPVQTNGTNLGVLALAPKRSGAAIDDSDLTLLAVVTAQLGIALQNAEYVRQIERQKGTIEELQKRLEAENVALRAEVRAASQFTEIIGASPALQRVLALVEKVAPTTVPILITGETGTGKELIARAIHDRSPRRHGPLISVNCPAIPPGLAESDLFGHERGAFTDAVAARPGKFELADGGTIFLDEVSDLPLDIQVKLLRVLQEHETQRVGGHKVRKLDLRVVAATNRNLQEEMRAGGFREDLYYRLAAVVIDVPPLRERAGDIPMLASYFLEHAATTYQKEISGFSADALNALSRYSWPGNIRELQHVIERAVLLCTAEIVKLEHLSDLAVTGPRHVAPQPLGARMREEKIRRAEQALAQTGGNQAAAARLLGMSSSNFARLLRSLGLKPPPPVQ